MKIFVLVFLAIAGFFGFTHFVQVNDSFTIIPKLSFTFSDTFITLDEVITRHNNQSVTERLRGDPQLDNLVRVLQTEKFISIKSEPDKESEKIPPKQNIPPQSYEKTDYPDIKSAIFDGQNAVGKSIRFFAKFETIELYYDKPVLHIWAETETGARMWYINFDDSYRNVVSGFSKDQRLNIMCTISSMSAGLSTCQLIKFL